MAYVVRTDAVQNLYVQCPGFLGSEMKRLDRHALAQG